MSGLAGVIRRRKTGSYTVTRQGEGAYVLGRWVPGAETTLLIDGSIQPITGDAAKELPEGVSVDNSRTLWTETALRTEAPGATEPGTGADTLLVVNVTYRVTKVEHFVHLSNFYRVTLVKVQAV